MSKKNKKNRPALSPGAMVASAPTAPPYEFDTSSLSRLAVIFFAAFLLRAFHLLGAENRYPFFNYFVGDAASYNDWGRRLAAGQAPPSVFFQDPLYPYFLGTIYRIFGYAPVLIRWIQIVFGSLSCAVISETARRLFDKKAAWFAGIISAAYGLFIFYEGTMLKESLVIFLSSLSLWGVVIAQQRPTQRHWFFAGTFLGGLMLTRGNTAVLVPITLSGLWMSHLGTRRSAILGAFFLAGFLLVLCPSALHNYRASGEPVMTTSQAGPNFYIGNHLGANGGYAPLLAGRETPEFEAEDFKHIAEFNSGRSLKPSEVSQFWFRKAVQFISEHPAAWMSLLWRKTQLFLDGYEFPDVEDYYLARRFSPILGLPMVSYSVLLPLAIAGMLCAAWRWRELFMLYGFALGNAASVILFYVFARYRIPAVSSLMVFAAGFLSIMLQWFQSRRRELVLIVGAATGALIWVETPRTLSSLPSSLANLGNVYRAQGQREKAISTMEEAIRLFPRTSVEAHFGLANLYISENDSQRAILEYQRTLELYPRHTEALYRLGAVYYNLKDLSNARKMWMKVLEIEPSHPGATQAIKFLDGGPEPTTGGGGQ